jgi:DNA modification methylase
MIALSETEKYRDLKRVTEFVASRDAEEARHRWYYFKEGFSPDLVRAVLAEAVDANERPRILDPFSGAGTTALVAAEYGLEATGFEVNPFLEFIARAKLSKCEPVTFLRGARAIRQAMKRSTASRFAEFSTFAESGLSEKWLFNREVLETYESAFRCVQSFHAEEKRLLLTALLVAVMENCNAVRDGKCLRYRKNWQSLHFDGDSLASAFESIVQNMFQDLRVPMLSSPSILLGDSRTSVMPAFDLCITSPPYLNSFDYTDVYRPELFLGEFVGSMEQLRALRQRTLRSHVQAKWAMPERIDFGPTFSEIYKAIDKKAQELWNPRLLLMLRAYFEDIAKVLANLLTQMSERASIWIVVSTSSYAGVFIPVDEIIGEVAEAMALKVRDIISMRDMPRIANQQWASLSTGGRSPFHRESVVILERAKS